jgi:hypothetical protein
LAVLNPEPLKPLAALPHVTPAPLDQLEKETPVGGVVHVAVGVAGQVILAPPPTVTTVCAKELTEKTLDSAKSRIKGSFFLIVNFSLIRLK